MHAANKQFYKLHVIRKLALTGRKSEEETHTEFIYSGTSHYMDSGLSVHQAAVWLK